MKRSVLLTITSLISVVLMVFHISDEIARGLEQGGMNMVFPLIVVAGLVYGILVPAGRWRYGVSLVVAILGAGIPIVHMSGGGLIGGRIGVDSSGSLFWVFQNMTLAIVSMFSLILAVRCLWNPEWAESR